jgi:hypothetical protein
MARYPVPDGLPSEANLQSGTISQVVGGRSITILAGVGDHRVTTPRTYSASGAHLVLQPALKRQDLARLAAANIGVQRVRFPLELPY